jgi:hypothetical protein
MWTVAIKKPNKGRQLYKQGRRQLTKTMEKAEQMEHAKEILIIRLTEYNTIERKSEHIRVFYQTSYIRRACVSRPPTTYMFRMRIKQIVDRRGPPTLFIPLFMRNSLYAYIYIKCLWDRLLGR